VVHLVNRNYAAMCQDYYALQFMDRSVDTSPIAPALATFFNDVLDRSVQELNFKARPCGRAPARPAPLLACAWMSGAQGRSYASKGSLNVALCPKGAAARAACAGAAAQGGMGGPGGSTAVLLPMRQACRQTVLGVLLRGSSAGPLSKR